MQGSQGEKGETGIRGEKGERGVHFHVLPLGSETEPEENSIRYAIEYGLDERDPFGDEYADGDMIIAYRSVSSNSQVYNYTDSIWKVEARYNEGLFDNYYPVEAIKYQGASEQLDFSMTTLFEEFITNQNPNRLIRPAFIDTNYKRGIVLNDYNHNILDESYPDGPTITGTLIRDVIDHNVVLIYTEALSEVNNTGSPHCGIVFYKNGDTASAIGDFPRINYVVSSDLTKNYLNLNAPNQGLQLHAKDDIVVESEEGGISLITNGDNTEFSVKHNNSKFIALTHSTNKNKLHLVSDEILFENLFSDDDVSSNRWLKIKDTGTNGTGCEIVLCKDNTYIQSDNFFSIGKTGLIYKTQENSAQYFNQSRISIINSDNDDNNTHIDIISPELYIGADPDYEGYTNNFGAVLKNRQIKLSTNSEPVQSSDPTTCDIAKVELNTENLHKANITLKTTYPGVTKISNVSEKYADSIINYYHSSIMNTQVTPEVLYNFYTSPMGDNLVKNGRYNYANMNCYCNMSIRNVNNMGAIHAGSIKFTGLYSTGTPSDELIYNFTRIGNVVHCHFHGVINTTKICARKNNTIKVTSHSLQNIGETYYKSNDQVIVDWPTSNTIAKNTQLPTYMSLPAANTLLPLSAQGGSSKKGSLTPSISMVSLNQIRVNLYPPVMKLMFSNGKFNTGITHFTGHMVYSKSGNIYEKELYYGDGNTTTVNSGNSTFYEVPSIKIRDMKSSSTSKIISSLTSSSDFTIEGTQNTSSSITTDYLVELNGYFSYIIKSDLQEDIHQNSNTATELTPRATVYTPSAFTYSSATNYEPLSPVSEEPELNESPEDIGLTPNLDGPTNQF